MYPSSLEQNSPGESVAIDEIDAHPCAPKPGLWTTAPSRAPTACKRDVTMNILQRRRPSPPQRSTYDYPRTSTSPEFCFAHSIQNIGVDMIAKVRARYVNRKKVRNFQACWDQCAGRVGRLRLGLGWGLLGANSTYDMSHMYICQEQGCALVTAPELEVRFLAWQGLHPPSGCIQLNGRVTLSSLVTEAGCIGHS